MDAVIGEVRPACDFKPGCGRPCLGCARLETSSALEQAQQSGWRFLRLDGGGTGADLKRDTLGYPGMEWDPGLSEREGGRGSRSLCTVHTLGFVLFCFEVRRGRGASPGCCRSQRHTRSQLHGPGERCAAHLPPLVSGRGLSFSTVLCPSPPSSLIRHSFLPRWPTSS